MLILGNKIDKSDALTMAQLMDELGISGMFSPSNLNKI